MNDGDKNHWVYKWGLTKNSTKEDITRAWRRHAQALHPDKTGNDETSNKLFIELKNQYEILRDDKKRRVLFDEVFEKSKIKQNNNYQNSTNTNNDTFNDTLKFKSSYYSPPSDINKTIFIPLVNMLNGDEFKILIKRARPCQCQREYLCYICKGVGQVFEMVMVNIYIPSYFPHKGYMTLDGMGDMGSHDNGDLILKIFYTNKYNWKYDGNNLYLHKKMPLYILNKEKVFIKNPWGAILPVKIKKINQDLQNNNKTSKWVGDGDYEFKDKKIKTVISLEPSSVFTSFFIILWQKYLGFSYLFTKARKKIFKNINEK